MIRSERNTPRSRLGTAAIFVAYCAMLWSVVPFHEPWSDEAEAWMAARLFPLFHMLFKVLRYEEHPSLWYLVLWAPAHMGMAYRHITVLSAVIAALGILVFVVLSPFPLYLRAVIPFTFYLAYQYAVVARSYVLFPLIGFLAAYVYRKHPEKCIWLGLLLGLMANVTFHGVLVACGIAVAYWLGVYRNLPAAQKTPQERRDFRIGGLLFVGGVLFTAICLWPASDSLAPRTKGIWLYHHLAIPVKMDLKPGQAPTMMGAPADFVVPPASVPAAPSVPVKKHWIPLDRFRQLFIRVPSFSYSTWPVVALGFQVLFIVYLVRRKKALLLLPMGLLLLFLSGVYNAPWHLGLMFVTTIILLWMAWDPDVPATEVNLQNAVAVYLFVLCVLQFPWTWRAIKNDRENIYSPGQGIADYIKTYPRGTAISGFGSWLEIEPYFTYDIFIHDVPYRGGTKPDPGQLTYSQTLALKPTLVVIDKTDTSLPRFLAAGYEVKKTECGLMYFPNLPQDQSCMLVLGYANSQPVATTPAANANQ